MQLLAVSHVSSVDVMLMMSLLMMSLQLMKEQFVVMRS